MWPNQQETADLVTFTKDNPNGKRYFLGSEYYDSYCLVISFSKFFLNKVSFSIFRTVNLKVLFKNSKLSINSETL